MSVVTNLIVCEFDSVGNDDPADCVPIKNINAWLAEHSHGGGLNIVGEETGGTKMLEMGVWTAAMNHMDSISELVNVVKSQEWENPDSVQLFVCEQEEYKFRAVIDGQEQTK